MFKKILLYLLLSAAALSMFFLLLTSEGQVESRTASSEDVRVLQNLSFHARNFLRDSTDDTVLQISHADLQSVLNVASDSLKPLVFHGAITESQLVINADMPLPAPFEQRIFSLSCQFEQHVIEFAINRCKAGQISIPGSLMMWLLRQSFAFVFKAPDDHLVFQLLLTADVSQQVLSFQKKAVLAHSSENNQLNATGNQFSLQSMQGPEHLEDLAPYFSLLSQLNVAYSGEEKLSFYLQQLLQAAASKPTSFETEASTALWALAIVAADRRFLHLTPSAVDTGIIPKLPRLKLGGREDLALHFLYSAAMRISANSTLALKIGAFKEISDAGAGGSGFSFIDMAANKAGIWLVDNIASINQQQLFILDSDAFEAAFMPEWHDLPEGLSESQLQKQFGGPDGAGAQALLQQIEQRLAELTLFR